MQNEKCEVCQLREMKCNYLMEIGRQINRKGSILFHFFLVALICMVSLCEAIASDNLKLSDQEAQQIGLRIWKNECGGTVDGLTSWNKGEDFASLGIGHFIWYPVGRRGPFEESFPKLLTHLQQHGVRLPDWLVRAKGCPWSNREEFQRNFQSERMVELRHLLKNTIALQARFAALRLERALPKILAAAPTGQREIIQRNFYRVAHTPMGLYALIDYVNFKGEGTSSTERYRGQGWGLLQVLEGMGNGLPLEEFAASADRVLTRRVQNAPPDRNEQRWLLGWRNRVQTYNR